MSPNKSDRESGHDQWAGVDQTSDPNWFISFLDASRGRSRAEIEQDPQRFYAYLDPQEGHHILDVGSGTGDLTRPLANLVGPKGRVVGVDYSRTMVDEARRRAEEEGSHAEFVQGDIHNLDFPDNTFNRAQVRLVLQHLPDPNRPLSEMVRILKPGGKLAVAEQDWEALLIDASDKELTRKVTNLFCDSIPNGWIGRKLFALFKEVGLEEVTVHPSVVMLPAYHIVDQLMGMKNLLNQLQASGAVTPEAAQAWVEEQQHRSETGRFFLSFTLFTVTGQKPL